MPSMLNLLVLEGSQPATAVKIGAGAGTIAGATLLGMLWP